MFKRRKKRSLLEKVRNIFWPDPGLKRTLYYHRHRIVRLPDTPYRIAAGFAIGSAVSFTPFIGFHILIGLVICFFIRANYIAAAIGTIIGNPWTFPFIWILIYNTGMWILGLPNDQGLMENVDGDLLLTSPFEALSPVIWPMIVGGIPIAFLAFWITYLPMISLIRKYREIKQRRMDERRQKRLETVEQANRESNPSDGIGE